MSSQITIFHCPGCVLLFVVYLCGSVCVMSIVSLIVPALALCSIAITFTAQLASYHLSLSRTQKYKCYIQPYLHTAPILKLLFW